MKNANNNCPACDGRGELTHHRLTPEVCPKCYGTGKRGAASESEEALPERAKLVRRSAWVAELGAALSLVEKLKDTAPPEIAQATKDLLRCAELDLQVASREERRRSATR